MNSLDIGTCLLTCDGSTVYCGEESVSVSSCSCVDGRVSLLISGFTIALLEEEWNSLVGVQPVEVAATEVVAAAPVKRGRKASS
jgi:hypothetical protein